MADIFVSYATQDIAVAKTIYRFINARGISCWMAPDDIPAGADYGEALINAVKQSKILILVYSKYSNESKHVAAEVREAFNSDKIIIPYRIENVEPSNRLAIFIGGFQWFDATATPHELHITKLLITIQNSLSIKPVAQPVEPVTSPLIHNAPASVSPVHVTDVPKDPVRESSFETIVRRNKMRRELELQLSKPLFEVNQKSGNVVRTLVWFVAFEVLSIVCLLIINRGVTNRRSDQVRANEQVNTEEKENDERLERYTRAHQDGLLKTRTAKGPYNAAPPTIDLTTAPPDHPEGQRTDKGDGGAK